MKQFWRRILPILLGIVVGTVMILGIEALSGRIYPPPPGFDFHDPEAQKRLVAAMPMGAFLLLLGGWLLGTFAGSWLAARLDDQARLRPAILVGAFFMAGSALNFIAIPHPHWFVALSLLCFVPIAYAGGKLGQRRPGAS